MRGRKMFLGLDFFFYDTDSDSDSDNPVFLFLYYYNTLLILPKDNTKRTIAFNLSLMFFSEKKKTDLPEFFFSFFFRKSYLPSP